MRLSTAKFYMKSDSGNKLKKVLTWLEYANDDLKTAQIIFLLSSNIPYRIIAYHSQQSAEKFIKAFLVFHSIDFPYTHNISALIELCEPIVDLNKKLKSAKGLSKYAVAMKYPNEYLKITKGEAKKSIEIAAKVKDEIISLLSKEGIVFKK
jgi:HEPN domain-containing protein